MTALASAIAGHADVRPAATAIDAGPSGQITYRMLADALPGLAEGLVAAIGPARRPVAVRLDHGPAACLIDLAMIEAGIPSVPLAPFFTPDQVTATLAASGCGWLIENGAVAIRDGGMPDLSFGIGARDAHAVRLPEATRHAMMIDDLHQRWTTTWTLLSLGALPDMTGLPVMLTG